jgi:futalosine hydrolase
VDDEKLRLVTRGCRVVLLAATETEMRPLLDGLRAPETHVQATKALFVGELGPECAPSEGGAGSAVRVVLAISGCDKANAAHVLTCLLQAMRPAPVLLLQVGIAGALPRAGREPGAAIGDIVVATQEAYSDTGSSSPAGWLPAEELGLPIACVNGTELGGIFTLDERLVRAAAEAIEAVDWSESGARSGAPPAVLSGPCVTASRMTGLRSEADAVARRWAALAESMEGAAAAHVCALYGVPFLEIRGISNLVVDRDRGAWQVDRAVAVAGRGARAVVAALDRLPLGGVGE